MIKKPKNKMQVTWNGYDCIIKTIKHRSKVIKLVADFKGKAFPFSYFWVDFNEVGF